MLQRLVSLLLVAQLLVACGGETIDPADITGETTNNSGGSSSAGSNNGSTSAGNTDSQNSDPNNNNANNGPEPGNTGSSDEASVRALLADAETLYEEQGCLRCHGATGEGNFPIEQNGFEYSALKTLIKETMPFPATLASQCDGACSEVLALYILNGYRTELSNFDLVALYGQESAASSGNTGGADVCDTQITQASAIRRLNRSEVMNAVRDVFGVGGNQFEVLPRDGTLGGFATVGGVLSSGSQFTEKYIEAATNAATLIVDSGAVALNCNGQAINTPIVNTSPIFQAGEDQCDTTAQCKNVFDQATDCQDSRSENSICMCGSQACNTGSVASSNNNSTSNETLTKDCLVDTIAPVGRLLYRRELSETELEGLYAVADNVASGSSVKEGLKAAVLNVLMSPNFLFVLPETEIIDRELTGAELATRMALTLWSSVPDKALLDAANSGALATENGFESQLNRMMADERFGRFKESFFAQWLSIANAPNADVDLQAVGISEAQWAEIIADMQAETLMFFDYLIRENRPVKELHTANYTFLNQRLADHYGIDVNVGEALTRTNLSPETGRKGIMTQGAVLLNSASGDHASVPIRGELALAGFLCQSPPAPPESLEQAIDDQNNSASTEKEKIAVRASNDTCLACHALMDPMGWSFTLFDVAGRFTTVDPDGDPVDPVGEFKGHSFDGVAELIDVVSATTEFETCLSQNFMIYSVGRGVDYYKSAEDQCVIDSVVENNDLSTLGMQDYIKALIKSPMFKRTGTQITN